MTERITLEQYRELTSSLRFVKPLADCCGKPLMETIHIEPLAGRNTLEVDRTCVLKCSVCGRMYQSRWD
jgi:hypothetical protein